MTKHKKKKAKRTISHGLFDRKTERRINGYGSYSNLNIFKEWR